MEGDEEFHLLSLSTIPEDSREETRRGKCKKFIILSSLFMAYLLVSAAYSIIAPFYPQEVGDNTCNQSITCYIYIIIIIISVTFVNILFCFLMVPFIQSPFLSGTEIWSW